jgi:hypothetical protein
MYLHGPGSRQMEQLHAAPDGLAVAMCRLICLTHLDEPSSLSDRLFPKVSSLAAPSSTHTQLASQHMSNINTRTRP